MQKIISVDSVVEGMVLSEPIINKFGQVLLGANVVISKKHINFFKIWNIELISIHTNEDEDNKENNISNDDYQTARENLFKRMLWQPRNQNEEDFVELGIIYEAKRLKLTLQNYD